MKSTTSSERGDVLKPGSRGDERLQGRELKETPAREPIPVLMQRGLEPSLTIRAVVEGTGQTNRRKT